MGDREYRMTYGLTFGPGKDRAALESHEGLTDIVVLTSVLGIPGGPGPLSVQFVQMGPTGAEPLSARLMHTMATALLANAVESEALPPPLAESAGAALGMLRKPFRQAGGSGG